MLEIHHGGAQPAKLAQPASALAPDEAHCERVATLTREICKRLSWDSQLRFVESVALLHHYLPTNVSERSGLLTDSLRAFHGILPRGGNPTAFQHSEVVRLANSFDEMLEWLEFEQQSIDHVMDELHEIAPLEGWEPSLMQALREISRDRWEDLLAAGRRLPVSAVTSVRKLACVPADDLTIDALYKVAVGDPCLAADILRVTNSPANDTLRGEVTSLRAAIVFLGSEKTRTVLLSSLARGFLASSSIRHLWQHSLAVAADAARLAGQCGCDSEQAMLAGLLHDIGRLAAEKLDSETLDLRARMRDRRAPEVWIDLVTCRHDHAEVASRLLSEWRFPAETVDAILNHHSPERSTSKLASVLYLAEQRNPDGEDMPSPCRLSYALETLGLTKWPLASSSDENYLAALTA